MNDTLIFCLQVLLLTSFVRVFTTLSILRYGLGLYASSFGVIVLSLSLAICFYVSSPYIENVGGLNSTKTYEEMQEEFKPFLEKKVDKTLLSDFQKKFVKNDTITKKQELDLLTFSFVVSELRDALRYSVIILIPFLIIDLIVMNIFMALGVKDFPYLVATLPIKLGVFVACDGLKIITDKLINYYV